ncbi:hypothetical protein H0A36_26070 [Endozoicomonas sp. SM1973]|uniref:Uncharacterized protein n=1 Tax=Spartinivicinus marinus TaxID=2994442 RepID=A0A853IG17_9GAMM|nr:hypothetical protein [Spartinivicinus marinus]MCX4030256.1 hypothetical protein [Spartinivicinus marinus]NYZ69488.1 hypothetical protein [Spartinivicinus marinus]
MGPEILDKQGIRYTKIHSAKFYENTNDIISIQYCDESKNLNKLNLSDKNKPTTNLIEKNSPSCIEQK